ncbi:MAG: Hydroxyacylglutathione hydrolase [Methanobacterium sp. PtaU1.Bin097]|jgi:glyoxylase-like metal-dependent hydrolase (beta-lactamase superfamily II)|nr:MAG: Hydroxyacylglutathione hydrolase [Methanobacterium sp. PtaU1.Bin097]
MKLKKYIYRKNKVENWTEVFQNPCQVTVRSFQTGTVKINRKGTLNPDHPLAGDVQEEELEVPILVYWVRHKEKGDILLDAGLDASYITDPYGGLEGSSVDEFKLGEHKNIAYHIQDHGIELKTVFLSHLHADHAAGVRELPRDIPYIISKGEYDEYQPEVHGDFLEGLEELYEIDFSQATKIPPIGSSIDILGDGSLWTIWTPGHTPGHMSFLVNGMEGPVLLTMDAAFIHENLETGVAPGDYTWNVEMAQETLEKIIEFLREYPQVRVGPGHGTLKLSI